MERERKESWGWKKNGKRKTEKETVRKEKKGKEKRKRCQKEESKWKMRKHTSFVKYKLNSVR